MSILYFVALVILLVLSAFFSGSETSLFSLKSEQQRELSRDSRRSAVAVTKLLEERSSLLDTILFGNMLVNVLFFSMSTMVAITLPDTEAVVFGLSSLAAVIVFGEVVPKVLAVNLSRQFALVCALPLWLCRQAFMPVINLLGRVVQWLARTFRLYAISEAHITEDELNMLVELSEQQGVISHTERELIAEVVDFAHITVGEVMTPRVDVPAFNIKNSFQNLRNLLLKTKWRKIPVYKNSRDNILGIIHAKDILLNDPKDIRPYIRKVLYVPELASVESVLRQFREKRTHLAVAVDEYGGFAGVVTVEDILEEIVGEIESEYEQEGPLVQPLGAGTFRLAGDLSIRDWRELFGVDVSYPGFDTIGGLVLLLLGHIPREGERVVFGDLEFTVERMRKRKIETIILRISKEEGAQ